MTLDAGYRVEQGGPCTGWNRSRGGCVQGGGVGVWQAVYEVAQRQTGLCTGWDQSKLVCVQ